MPDYSGQSIGRYHIIEPLGQGGMATVYRAYDTRLECDVAVKFIRMERLTPEEKERTLKRFEREAKELARLTHPNIVKVTDFGKYKSTPYLVMEYLPGGTLKQFAGRPLPYDQAARLLAPVARALEAAHKRSLVHRDIKPGNILLTEEGQPMVSDFGIAKILDVESGASLTSTNVAIGTPEYMAPEQWLNQVSAQTDIYALGIVFYELVTGQRPYTADTPAAIFLKQSNDPLPRPRSFVPGLPDEVEKVLFKALAKSLDDRYASMAEFAAALEGLGGQSRPAPSQPQPQKVSEAVDIPEPVAPAVPDRLVLNEQTVAASSKPLKASSQPSMAVQEIPASSSQPPVVIEKAPAADVQQKVESPALPLDIPQPEPRPGPRRQKRARSRTAVWLGGAAVLILLAAAGIFYGLRGVGPLASLTARMLPQVSVKDGMPLMYVPAGNFLMGSVQGDIQAYGDEKPQHTVYLSAYFIDKFEVTNRQYQQCVQANGCTPPYKSASSTRSNYYVSVPFYNYPVIYASWSEAEAYCKWAGRRLPSEAEWEKAARGTDGRIYPWGEGLDCTKANYAGCKGDTTEVGSYPSGASPYGALDMAGNVSEWVKDWYSDTYYQQPPARDPKGPSNGDFRVMRGGSWISDKSVRSTFRERDLPFGIYNVGFRCAVSADQ